MGVPESAPRHRILVVDDDESSRDIVRRSLQAEHEVLVAENGEQAIGILDQQPVDLLLLDVMLPEEPGFEICRRVKSRERDGYLPVVLLSALHEQEDRNQGLAAGADDYLTKPFDRNELRLRVNTFLRLRDQDLTIRAQVAEAQRLQGLKDDMVALIAHDLRNPLLGIQGNLDLLKRQTGNPERADLAPRVDGALASTEELRGILDSLLDARLLEDRRLSLQLETTRIGELLEEVRTSLEGAAAAKSVTLRLAVEGEAVARVDRRLVRRATGNLLSNAIRYAPRASIVDLGAREDGGSVAIEIADRGPGVPGHLKGDLFQKFGPVAQAPDGRQKGYGLGLYLVRLVAEAHGGRAWVADREGGGAVFTLILSR